MIEKDLDKVLNYMKQYVENKYEHDSEPMLNWKDLKLVLEEIERLQKLLNIEKNKREQFDKNNQLLHSIIKEVREKIKKHLYAKTILSDMYSDNEIFEFILEKTGDIDEQR